MQTVRHTTPPRLPVLCVRWQAGVKLVGLVRPIGFYRFMEKRGIGACCQIARDSVETEKKCVSIAASSGRLEVQEGKAVLRIQSGRFLRSCCHIGSVG